MSLGAAIKLEGGTEALRALKELDETVKNETIRNIRSAAKPLENAAKALTPAARPMSGWKYGRYAYNGSAKGGISTKVGGRGRKTRTTWPLKFRESAHGRCWR